MFSTRDVSRSNNPGKYSIDKTPMNFDGRILSMLKAARKYHSGRISRGVENGAALSSREYGALIAKPAVSRMNPKMTTGKMYKMSLGHAGSP